MLASISHCSDELQTRTVTSSTDNSERVDEEKDAVRLEQVDCSGERVYHYESLCESMDSDNQDEEG